MDVEASYFIGHIKTLLAASEGMPVDMLRLAQGKEILTDNRMVSQLGISPMAFLHVRHSI